MSFTYNSFTYKSLTYESFTYKSFTYDSLILLFKYKIEVMTGFNLIAIFLCAAPQPKIFFAILFIFYGPYKL